MTEKRKFRGRPPKFKEDRRPITVTLPERTLQQLSAINSDRARAIVKATAMATGFKSSDRPLVDIVEAYPGQAVIVVGPSKRLHEIEKLRLVEIAPARYLLVIPTGMAIESLEVAIGDLLDRLKPDEAYEFELLTKLYHIMRRYRRQEDVTKAEILLIRTDKG